MSGLNLSLETQELIRSILERPVQSKTTDVNRALREFEIAMAQQTQQEQPLDEKQLGFWLENLDGDPGASVPYHVSDRCCGGFSHGPEERCPKCPNTPISK